MTIERTAETYLYRSGWLEARIYEVVKRGKRPNLTGAVVTRPWPRTLLPAGQNVTISTHDRDVTIS